MASIFSLSAVLETCEVVLENDRVRKSVEVPAKITLDRGARSWLRG
jgi:hypothetical protein